MENTKFVLDSIMINGEVQKLIACSDGENTTVTYKGKEVTLSAALASIFAEMSNQTNGEAVDAKISTAISELIGGAPETYDTLKEIADYIATHEDAAAALNAAIGNKVDKEDGKGLSAEDFTTILKKKLEALPDITAEQVENWNAGTKTATADSDGLMSKEDKTKLDRLSGVRYGAEVPDDLKEGEMFIKVVEQETT
ncbi:MAG: hypothetical protein HDT47_02940 [Ruminococcaceae bacterium]|nr:hypothetical protein [Oscillospiraceae bacterium]